MDCCGWASHAQVFTALIAAAVSQIPLGLNDVAVNSLACLGQPQWSILLQLAIIYTRKIVYMSELIDLLCFISKHNEPCELFFETNYEYFLKKMRNNDKKLKLSKYIDHSG